MDKMQHQEFEPPEELRDNNASLKTLADEYGDRIRDISGSAKDRLAVKLFVDYFDASIGFLNPS